MTTDTVFDARGVDTSFQAFAPTCTDGYKIGHGDLYPKSTDFVYGNFTPRSNRLFIGSKSQSVDYDHKVVWVGVQGIMREVHGLWQRTFFDIPKEKAIARYSRRMAAYLGDGEANVSRLAALHDLGHLPITVLAINEGERLNINVPGYAIFSFGVHTWIKNYLETIMSSLLWPIVTNATIAFEYRRVFERYAKLTGVDRSFIDVQGHDFSFRGVEGYMAAASMGFGHLCLFAGTDTLPAIDYAEDMYFADVEKEFVAVSVVATEHAVTTTNILSEVVRLAKLHPDYSEAKLRSLGERAFILRAITEVHPTGIISLVSDSFDYWNILGVVLPSLKEEILARQPNASGFARVVVRPDSGDPVEVICGMEVFTSEELIARVQQRDNPGNHTKHQLNAVNGKHDVTKAAFDINSKLDAEQVLITHGGALFRAYRVPLGTMLDKKATMEIPGLFGYRVISVYERPLTDEEKGSVQVLWEHFDGGQTSLGYRTLNDRVGLIYGDSITVHRAEEILRRLMKKGFASSNVVFGIGSYTYQHNTRDTFGIAVKATAARVDGEIVQLFKAPATEKDTLKKSAKGFLKVVKEGNDFILLQEQDIDINRLREDSGELKPIYDCGVFPNVVKHSQIKERLLANFN